MAQYVHQPSNIGFSLNSNKIQNQHFSFPISDCIEFDTECDTMNERIYYGYFAAVVQISDQTKFSIFAHIHRHTLATIQLSKNKKI